MIRVLISENTPGEADEIAHKLASAEDIQIVGYARDGLEAAQMAAQLRPDVALIHTRLAGMDGFQACQMARVTAVETGCVLLAPPDEENEDTWRRAMVAGARGLLSTEASAAHLLSVVQELGAAKQPKDQHEYQLVTDPSKMPVTIAITGAKGGIGKTTLATNLAICLQHQFPGQVVLVDFVGQYGDVPLLLDMRPRVGLGELMLHEELDADLVQSHLTEHSSGLQILAGPNGTDIGRMGTQIDVTSAANLGSILRSEYRFVVFDVPALAGNVSAYLFSRCNFIVVVTYLLDLAAIRDTSTLIESLAQTQMPSDRIKLVVNRRSQRNPFSIADLQQTVNHPIDAQVPEDVVTVTSALNEGIPVVLKSPGSAVAKAIKKLCNSLIAELPSPAQATPRAAAQPAPDVERHGEPAATVN